MTQRTSAKRRPAGAEDHRKINILGRGDHAFVKATRGLVDHDEHEAVPRPRDIERTP